MLETSSAHFTKGVAKVIVSDYRYFLFAIYDWKLAQGAGDKVFTSLRLKGC
jgi:hypothetical protein